MITEEKGIELMDVYFTEWRNAAKKAKETSESGDLIYAAECKGSYNTMKLVLEVING